MIPRAASVRLLCLDVDGVLTEGAVVLDGEGRELKSFSVRDGLGIVLWQRLGGKVAVLTGRSSGAVVAASRSVTVTRREPVFGLLTTVSM